MSGTRILGLLLRNLIGGHGRLCDVGRLWGLEMAAGSGLAI